MMDELGNSPKPRETPRFARLSDQQLSWLLQQSRESGFARVESKVDYPGFPGGIVCKWEAEHVKPYEPARPRREGEMYVSPHSGGPNRIIVGLWHQGHRIGEMKSRIVQSAGGDRVWNLWHRYVDPKERGKELGSFTLQTTEEFLAALKSKDASLPDSIESTSSMPSVIGLLQREGYEFETKEEKATYTRFSNQVNKHQNDKDFRERGILPSFLIVRRIYPDTQQREGALISKKKLKEFEVRRKANAKRTGQLYTSIIGPHEKIGSSELNYRTLRTNEQEILMLPFVVSFRLSKKIPD